MEKCFEKMKGYYQQDLLYQSQALSFFTAISLIAAHCRIFQVLR